MVVLIVLAISAYMTLKGLFAVWRVNTLDTLRLDTSAFGAAHSDLPSVVSALAGGGSVKVALSLAIAAAVAAFAFAARDFRESRPMILGGFVVGAVIVGGWYVTGHLGHLAEDPRTLEEAFVATNSRRPESYSFVAPVAYTLELLLLWSDQSRIVTFGIAGALAAWRQDRRRWRSRRRFRAKGSRRSRTWSTIIAGGVLMGFGGVCALGCTVGQGLSGISTLAVGSFLALAAIVGGCIAALKYQYWRAG